MILTFQLCSSGSSHHINYFLNKHYWLAKNLVLFVKVKIYIYFNMWYMVLNPPLSIYSFLSKKVWSWSVSSRVKEVTWMRKTWFSALCESVCKWVCLYNLRMMETHCVVVTSLDWAGARQGHDLSPPRDHQLTKQKSYDNMKSVIVSY